MPSVIKIPGSAISCGSGFGYRFDTCWPDPLYVDLNVSVVKTGHGGRYGGAMADFGGPPPQNLAFRTNLAFLVKIGQNHSQIGENQSLAVIIGQKSALAAVGQRNAGQLQI